MIRAVARNIPPTEWADWDDNRLLDLRLCDLELKIEATDLEDRIGELNRELDARGLEFRPHFWLSDEWFCPDGVPGIAIPFYLAHPRLARLEMSQMLEVEGGTREHCLQILRHEAGHAIENAYGLRKRTRRQQLFGRTTAPYPDAYSPKPHSRSFVNHLNGWYAQAHPDEDFAETFAVWLTPGINWRERYAGWPVLRKLQYVDRVAASLRGTPQKAKTRRAEGALHTIRRTLRRHYQRRRAHYGVLHPDAYDRSLRVLFVAPHPTGSDTPSPAAAAAFLERVRRAVRRRVQRWTGEYAYAIDRTLQDIIERCRQLDLRLAKSEVETEMQFTAFVTAQIMAQLHRSRKRLPL